MERRQGLLRVAVREAVLDVAGLESPVGVESPVKEGYEPLADKNIPAVRAFRSGAVVIQSADELSEAARRAGIRSLVHVPMASREGSVGVLSLGTRDEGAFAKRPPVPHTGCTPGRNSDRERSSVRRGFPNKRTNWRWRIYISKTKFAAS